MPNDDNRAGVTMWDVRQSFVAVREDTPVQARIVAFLVLDAAGKPSVRFTAQACDSEGTPLLSVPSHARDWPAPGFRTVTQLLHFLLERVYASVTELQDQAARRQP